MKLLEKHFEIALETPDGITRLRELILKLAMQGKLVEQNLKGQSANELIEEINKERQKLIKLGKIRKQKELEKIKNDEILHELPTNWKWVRLNDFGTWKSGSTPNRSNNSFYDGNIPWVKSGEVKQGLIKDTSEKISEQALEKCSLDLNPVGSILVAMYGANIGEVGILDIEATTNQAVCACNPFSLIDNKFLFNLILSLKQNFISQGAGAAQPNISREKIINTIVPLPPYEEQKRIVEKIDQLMLLCDKLEEERNSKNKLHLQINSSAINNLIKANDEISFNDSWSFIANKFDTLYTVKQNVTDLKDAILNLAIKGKLIIDIQNKETEIISNNKYIIDEKDYPFSLPKGWKWLALNDLGLTQTGTTPATKNTEYYGDFMPFIGPGDIKNQVIDYTNLSLSELGVEKARLIPKNSIMMVCIGGSIGKLAINNRDVACNQQINTVTPYSDIDLKYLFAVLQSSYFQNHVLSNASGSATPIINKQKWGSIPIPIPPYEIQKRISKRIDDLFKLCSDLENKIELSSKKQSQLLNAVLAQV